MICFAISSTNGWSDSGGFFLLIGIIHRRVSVPACATEYAAVYDWLNNNFFYDVVVFCDGPKRLAEFVFALGYWHPVSAKSVVESFLLDCDKFWRRWENCKRTRLLRSQLMWRIVAPFWRMVLEIDKVTLVIDKDLSALFVKVQIVTSLGVYSCFCWPLLEQTGSV